MYYSFLVSCRYREMGYVHQYESFRGNERMSFQSNTQPLIGGSPDTGSRLWFDVMTMIDLIDNEPFGLEIGEG